MLLSLVVYATIWGWRYAAGFIALLFAREMGHYVAARRRGLDVGAPTFIPFVGAWIALKDQPVDVETEAYVAIAGPVVRDGRRARGVSVGEVGGQRPAAGDSLFRPVPRICSICSRSRRLAAAEQATAALSPRIWFLGLAHPAGVGVAYRPSPMLARSCAILAALPAHEGLAVRSPECLRTSLIMAAFRCET